MESLERQESGGADATGETDFRVKRLDSLERLESLETGEFRAVSYTHLTLPTNREV